ncbi:zinc finger and SCAN domain-containing protein 2-like [Armigeres subalbatus]|uniref:zinc finger and SCAN domain-containing protein 2-like n=1 Tax=Armigeres subalbatus TaxID=124917 RepID=UPI002ED45E0E
MESNLVCRLCLYNNENIVSIFGDRQKEIKLQDKLLQYLNLDVKEDDTLPRLICMKCLQTVESFHIFYQEVAQNQTVFAYSSQPGMIVISDQNSHTTYILREEEIVQPSCIEVTDGLQQHPQHYSGVLGSPSTAGPSGSGGHQKLTLVQLPSQGTTTLLNTDLPPTYDEAQKRKEEQKVATVAKQELQLDIVDPIDTSEDEERLEDVEMLPSGDSDEPYRFTMSPNSDSRPPTEEYLEDEIEEVNFEDADDDDDDDDEVEEDYEVLHTDNDGESEIGTKNVSEFPQELIRANRLIVRGQELSRLIAKFYELTCELCNEGNGDSSEKFLTLEAYLTHFKDAHGAKGYVWCCNKRIIKPKLMAMHMARHIQPDAFKCPECNKLMTTPRILQYHMQNHRPEEERPYKCTQCPRRFSYASALSSHSQSHLPEKERTQYVCDECGKSYSSAKYWTEHIALRHSKVEPLAYVCHVCAKRFTSKSNLTYHLTTHQPKIHQVQCDQCQKWLKNKLCLRKHMVQHSMVRHKCNLCDYSALNLQCLKNHLRVQHTDSKPFACDVCGKSFKLKNTLLNHQVQHTGVKKFSCEFCARTFASSGNYYAHRKRMHPQELAVQKKRKEDEENEFRKKTLLTETV